MISGHKNDNDNENDDGDDDVDHGFAAIISPCVTYRESRYALRTRVRCSVDMPIVDSASTTILVVALLRFFFFSSLITRQFVGEEE